MVELKNIYKTTIRLKNTVKLQTNYKTTKNIYKIIKQSMQKQKKHKNYKTIMEKLSIK